MVLSDVVLSNTGGSEVGLVVVGSTEVIGVGDEVDVGEVDVGTTVVVGAAVVVVSSVVVTCIIS